MDSWKEMTNRDRIDKAYSIVNAAISDLRQIHVWDGAADESIRLISYKLENASDYLEEAALFEGIED